MPKPKKYERKKAFIARCIPVVMREAKAKGRKITRNYAVAKCYGIYESHGGAY